MGSKDEIKFADTVLRAIKSWKLTHSKLDILQTDVSKEFVNKDLKSLLKKN